MNRLLHPGPTLSLALLLATGHVAAQMHHVDQPQQVTRAIGVYEWTGDLRKPDAARLIPVSLFINGHFEDAGVYLAQPVPLALETGNVYLLQRSGDPIGTVDIDLARNVVTRKDVADDNPLGAWYGYGRYLPLQPKPAPKLHPSVQLASINSSDDDRPHFVNRSPAPGSSDSSDKSAKSSGPANTPAGQPADDPDRPHMARRADSGSGSGSTSSTDNAPASPGTDTVPDDDPERPTLGRRDETQEHKHHKYKDGGSVEPMSTSLNDDPDRPDIHRGKVASEQTAPPLTGLPADVHEVVAVSDPATREPHVFARAWDSATERAETLAAIEKIAQPLAQQYLATNHLVPVAPSTAPKLVTTKSATKSRPTTPASRRATHRTTKPATPAPLPFQQEQITGFELSYGGLPTFVYSAAVPTTATGDLVRVTVRVTVVTQRLPSGELQTSLSSVTDDAHLDRSPWMRLVDAVDPDDSHRASLLFELRARASRQFALYSLTSAQAQQSFVTGVIE